jgi:hypothetical protein
MKTYIQLKDDIAFAIVQSDNPVNNSVELDDSTELDSVLGKKKTESGWIEPEKIYFVSNLSDLGVIKEIKNTIFPSEVNGEIVDASTKTQSIKVDGAWLTVNKHMRNTYPTDGQSYEWDDETITWILVPSTTEEVAE